MRADVQSHRHTKIPPLLFLRARVCAYRLAAAEDHEAVKHGENVGARLVDRHDDGALLAESVRFEEAANCESVCRVQARRWLDTRKDRKRKGHKRRRDTRGINTQGILG